MVKTLTDENFATEIKKEEKLYLVDFWATWCGPCQMMGPVVDSIADEYAGKIAVGKVNVDENQQIAAAFDIQSIPTLLFFRGGNLVHKLIGAQPVQYLEQTILYLLGSSSC